MSNLIDEYEEIRNGIMNYLEYLYVNDLELDEDGNEVSKDTKRLILCTDDGEDDE